MILKRSCSNLTDNTIVQYGNFKINQENLDAIHLQMNLYILAAINHNLNIESYLDVYGKEYATNVPPNITDKHVIMEYITKNKPVPFYAQSGINSLEFIAQSLNEKEHHENLIVLMLLVDNYEANFDYIELELDKNNTIEKAYKCNSVIVYEELGDSDNIIDIQAVFKEISKKPISVEEISIID